MDRWRRRERRMLSMLKRHEVEILLKAGHGKVEVARLTGVSLCSVKRIAQEGPVVHVDDAAERAQRQVGRPSTVANFRKPSLEILRRVREAGYEGGKTALYALVASLRPKSAKPLVRFEGLPGEFSQHDFGEIEVEFVSGTRRRIHFFASRLKYSRLMRVSLVPDEAVESLVRTLAEHRVFSVRLRELRGAMENRTWSLDGQEGPDQVRRSRSCPWRAKHLNDLG